MSRYVKLEDLQKFPIRINYYDKKNGNEHFVYGVESVLEYAEYLPTADVVEVVRCRDCKYYEIHKPTITLNCEREGKLIPMLPNDYCSYGERRDGNG